MNKKLLFAAFIFFFVGIKAQINQDKKILLEGFDENKARQELKQKGLDPKEFISIMRRQYMAKRAKEVGIVNKQKNTHVANANVSNGKNHPTADARNGNSNTVFSSVCPNSSFQLLNFNGWSGDTGSANISPQTTYGSWTVAINYGTPGTYSYAPHPINAPLSLGGPVPTILSDPITGNQISTPNRHNIMNAPPVNNNPASPSFSGYDSLALNPVTLLSEIPVVSPSGSGTSLRLGNANIGGETESITYSINVTNSTSLFTYQYAVVLYNPGGSHTTDQQPKFVITSKDQYGNPLDSATACGTYSVNTDQAATDTSFKFYALVDTSFGFPDTTFAVYYKKWTSVSVDLTHYIGQNVSITFQTFDCSKGGHFGYAYIDAFCGSPASATSVNGFCGTTTGSVTIVAPPGFSSYQWYGPAPNYTTTASGTGANTQTLTTTAATNDTFLVKTISPSGCNSSFKVVVKQSQININTSSISTCVGGSGGSVTANAGSGSYSYSWSGPSGALGTNTVVTNLSPGAYTVQVTDNTHQCPTKDTVVYVTPIIPPLQTTTANFCGTVTTLTAPTSYSSTPYIWYDNANTFTGVTTKTNAITNAANGQHYTVTYLDSASHCEDSLRINLNRVNLSYNVSSGSPCPGGTLGGYLNYINNSSTNFSNSYNWVVSGATSSSGTVASTAQISLTGLGAGTYTMVITAPGNTSCLDSVVYTLTSSTVVTTNYDSTHHLCNMDTLKIINTQPNVTHNWSGPNIPSGANLTADSIVVYPAFTNTVNGFYTYTDNIHTVPGNCLSINEYVIKIKSFKANNPTVVEPLSCYNASNAKIRVNVSSEKNGPISTPDTYTFTWSSANVINSPNPTHSNYPASSSISNLSAGTYSCTIQNGNCIEEVTYQLTNPPKLPIDTIYSYYCPKDSLALLVANPGYTNYVWHPSNTGASVTGDSIMVLTQNVNSYYVTFLNNNCPDTGRIMIHTATHNSFLPNQLVNVFSPNGDGRNDVFYPFYQANSNQYEIAKQSNNLVYALKIYDRWGTLMFETTDYSTPWNGKTKGGNTADAGTYFYYVTYESNCATNADKTTKKGFVELMR